MSSLRVLTNLSMIPNLFPPDICSSFDTLESNLILYLSGPDAVELGARMTVMRYVAGSVPT